MLVRGLLEELQGPLRVSGQGPAFIEQQPFQINRRDEILLGESENCLERPRGRLLVALIQVAHRQVVFRAAMFRLSGEPGIQKSKSHLDGRPNSHGLSIFPAWLKFPAADRFLGGASRPSAAGNRTGRPNKFVILF